ncbi:MAG: hypothetical protein D6675_11300 [Gemmatimonadetes bacterium]|nr:MAG: hypothetical protein D6675_11300 [Gemmatimonadota bacterium]
MKIVHVSDLHLRDHLPGTSDFPYRKSREMPDRLHELLRQIQFEDPDLLVISGDLLDYPLDEMDNPERQAQAEADLYVIADMLYPLDFPYVVLPGNHDQYEVYHAVFGDLPVEHTIQGYRIITFCDAEAADHVPERVGEQRDRFERVLQDDDPRPQIHIQHFVIAPEIDHEYPHNYRDAAVLQDQIVHSGKVRLVLSGHYHSGVKPFQTGTTTFAVIPAFCERPHPYWIYELMPDHVQFTAKTLLPVGRELPVF